MLKTFLPIITFSLTLVGAAISANEIDATDRDLKAAYCIGIHTKAEQVIKSMPENLREEPRFQGLKSIEDDLYRLRAYLVPRVKRMPNEASKSVMAAMRSGERDSERSSQDVDACAPKCETNACVEKCLSQSAALIRTRTCSNLDFLPF